MKISTNKLRKCNSAAHFTIQFDPNEAKVGKSAIDKLPIKRPSSSRIPDKSNEKNRSKVPQQLNKQAQQYELTLLRRINESLQRQNKTLKKQLQYFSSQANSRRSSVVIERKQQDIKDKILNRIYGGKLPNKTDNESTSLGNSKVFGRSYGQGINELFEKYTNKAIKPTIENLYEVCQSYFSEFKENYIKIKCLYDDKKEEQASLKIKMDELLTLFKVPILYQDKPGALIKSISKDKFKKNSSKRIETQIPKVEEFCPELSSPKEILKMLDSILKLVLKSPKLMDKLKISPIYRAVERKLNH